MPKKPETVFRERVTPLLKKLPHTHVISVQQVSIKGTPDHILCVNGLFISLEYKKDEHTKPFPLQLWNRDRITAARGRAFVVHPGNWGAVYAELQRLAAEDPDHL